LAQFALHQNNQIWPVAYNNGATIDPHASEGICGVFECGLIDHSVESLVRLTIQISDGNT
jgi:hypothetical protein